MQHSIWQFIAETPWWVYVIIIGLFYYSYLLTKPRTVLLNAKLTLKPMFISNIIYILLVLGACIYLVPFTLFNVELLFGMTVLGLLFGWLQYFARGIKITRNPLQLHTPKSWLNFITYALIVIAAFVRYGYLGININDDINMIKSHQYAWICGVGGLVIGMTLGRGFYLWNCFRKR